MAEAKDKPVAEKAATIRCRVVADKIWDSDTCRFLYKGDFKEFPAMVKDATGKMVPFRVTDSIERVVEEKAAAEK